MRFYHTPDPKKGQKRTVRIFLWWPVTLDHETRWLETAEITQEYKEDKWKNIWWVKR